MVLLNEEAAKARLSEEYKKNIFATPMSDDEIYY